MEHEEDEESGTKSLLKSFLRGNAMYGRFLTPSQKAESLKMQAERLKKSRDAPYEADLFGAPVARPAAARPKKGAAAGNVDTASTIFSDDSKGSFVTSGTSA